MFTRETISIDDAAELTNRCVFIEFRDGRPEAERFRAVLYLNETVIDGLGKTTLDAVLSAHNALAEAMPDIPL